MSAWTTVGVGQNIIEASWEALCEAYLYGLIHTDDASELPGAELAMAR
jgi:2-isopropylmalate synthase